MSESEEENFCFYGKPLDPYDEDAFPKKRPITVEEQIATDSQGRRRFHGAFTGGFSAGFFNTVGSLEGWLPGDFKSSRGDKQKHVLQNPEDFMDDEDMGEFGFAPQSIRATKDYDNRNKRKRKVFSDGPIPGEPVLHSLLTTGNETIGHLLLKNIGMKEKIKTREEMTSSINKTYGCEMPTTSSIPETLEIKDYVLPDFYNKFLSNPKKDTFSLGYVGLDKSHVNLFRSSDLVVQEKNKKLSIRGQAFGVGAFENDDDDIYAKDDMSNYDFELTKEQEKAKNKLKNSAESVLDIFIKAKVNTFRREVYPPPVIPKSFTGRHKIKKSRFEPINVPEVENIDRRNIDATKRARLLGEETNENVTVSKTTSAVNSTSDYVMDKYVKEESSKCDRNENLETTTSQKSKHTTSTFDPSSLFDDRFVSGTQDDEATNILTPVKKYEIDHYGKEMKDAAKMKMYGPLTRISEDWQPCALLCKRFNVPEPLSDKPRKSQTRIKMKNLIFEYQKHHEENVTFKSGLAQVSTSKQEEVNLIENNSINDSDIRNNSLLEAKEETIDNSASEGQVVEVKQEVIEQGENNNEMNQVETEKLDEVLDITDKLNIEEKGDLFRAVFQSSSESEDEPDEEHNKTPDEIDNSVVNAREMELKSNILGEEVQIPKIKPIKEGILSGLNFKSLNTFTKPVVETKEDENKLFVDANVTSNNVQSDLYGPKLPEKSRIDIFPSNTPRFSKAYSDSSSDEWVEKNEIEKYKKKKQKRDKSSHKKKHKHKKKKKH